METINKSKQTLAFINDKSPIVDIICNDLINLGFDILYRSENIGAGISRLSALKSHPEICIVDLDFYNTKVLEDLQELRTKYPSIKLIAFGDVESKQVVKSLLNIGFVGYLLVGSDRNDFKKAIEIVSDGRRYFSTGLAKTAQEDFSNN